MSQTNGRLTTCDCCGATVFSKCTGEGETDGGFTRWNKFEPLPEGWEFVHVLGRLCPKCMDRYKRKWARLEQEMKEEAEQCNTP
jgi:uncharacterized protein YbdZ (MbtH family)